MPPLIAALDTSLLKAASSLVDVSRRLFSANKHIVLRELTTFRTLAVGFFLFAFDYTQISWWHPFFIGLLIGNVPAGLKRRATHQKLADSLETVRGYEAEMRRTRKAAIQHDMRAAMVIPLEIAVFLTFAILAWTNAMNAGLDNNGLAALFFALSMATGVLRDYIALVPPAMPGGRVSAPRRQMALSGAS